ncbi:MAG: hypothetical protein Sylvanvirus15_8 [Sylvanvirus sp.]|uniref:Uncharacterized protein n=1 Tax=Sylvanvirus sp. TaxID=2487774 RepID=A0A3G5AIE6_9VIRU|nr:MAG: hypothetical protein Sylvanvirus15_8 [Sylvanvirus sp.]
MSSSRITDEDACKFIRLNIPTQGLSLEEINLSEPNKAVLWRLLAMGGFLYTNQSTNTDKSEVTRYYYGGRYKEFKGDKLQETVQVKNRIISLVQCWYKEHGCVLPINIPWMCRQWVEELTIKRCIYFFKSVLKLRYEMNSQKKLVFFAREIALLPSDISDSLSSCSSESLFDPSSQFDNIIEEKRTEHVGLNHIPINNHLTPLLGESFDGSTHSSMPLYDVLPPELLFRDCKNRILQLLVAGSESRQPDLRSFSLDEILHMCDQHNLFFPYHKQLILFSISTLLAEQEQQKLQNSMNNTPPLAMCKPSIPPMINAPTSIVFQE